MYECIRIIIIRSYLSSRNAVRNASKSPDGILKKFLMIRIRAICNAIYMVQSAYLQPIQRFES